jgi:hypothetical protein
MQTKVETVTALFVTVQTIAAEAPELTLRGMGIGLSSRPTSRSLATAVEEGY